MRSSMTDSIRAERRDPNRRGIIVALREAIRIAGAGLGDVLVVLFVPQVLDRGRCIAAGTSPIVVVGQSLGDARSESRALLALAT